MGRCCLNGRFEWLNACERAIPFYTGSARFSPGDSSIVSDYLAKSLGKLCTSSEVHITGTELQWRAFPLEMHKTVTCTGRIPWEKRCTSLVYRVIPHLDVGRVVTLNQELWSLLCEYSHHALRGHFRERTVHLFVRFPETDHGVLTPRHTETRQCLLQWN